MLRKRKGAFHTCLKRHLVQSCFQAVVRPHTTQVTDVPRASSETCAEPADAHEFRIEFMNTQAARGLTGRSKPVACGRVACFSGRSIPADCAKLYECSSGNLRARLWV